MERKNSYSFFQNRECQHFPCHQTEHPEHFNCLFCYCPLYTLGDQCGGYFRYIADGVKDCSGCMVPHAPGGYEYILSRMDDAVKLALKNKRGAV